MVSAASLIADMADEAMDHVAFSMKHSSSKRTKLVQPPDGMYVNGTGKYQPVFDELRKEGDECSLSEAPENVKIVCCIYSTQNDAVKNEFKGIIESVKADGEFKVMEKLYDMKCSSMLMYLANFSDAAKQLYKLAFDDKIFPAAADDEDNDDISDGSPSEHDTDDDYEGSSDSESDSVGSDSDESEDDYSDDSDDEDEDEE